MSGREVLDSWKAIAAYLRRDVRTCQNWEKDLHLPVHRLDGSPKARVFAYKDEIDRWMQEKLREREAGELSAGKKLLKRALFAAAGLVLLAVAGFLFLRFVLRPDRPWGSPDRPTVAVLDFENLSKDAGLDYWKDGLPELLITGLSQSHFVSVLTREQSDSIIKMVKLAEDRPFTTEDLARIGVRGGLSRIVTGSFLKAGDGIVITLTLLDSRTGQVVERMNAELKDQNEIFTATNDLALRIKQGLNLSRSQMAKDAGIYSRIEVATTASPAAFEYYLEGRRLHLRMEYRASIAYMEKAIAIDPGFAMAYRSLASAYRNLGHMGQALRYARQALDLSARLPELEKLHIEGAYHFWEGNYPAAVAIWEKLLRIYPQDLSAYTALSIIIRDLDRVVRLRDHVYRRYPTALTAYNLADAYMMKGQYQKAEELCRSFLADVEDSPGVRDGLCLTYLARQRFDQALAEAERISLPRPENEYFRIYVGDVKLLMGDSAGAEAIYRRAPLLKAYVNRSNLMILHLARGQFSAAVIEARRNLDAAGDDRRLQSGAYEDLAVALEKAGRLDEADRIWGEYLDVSASWRRSGDDDTKYDMQEHERAALFIHGLILAERGASEEAGKIAAELKTLCEKTGNPRELRYPEFILGLVELGQKRTRNAIDLLTSACAKLTSEVRWENSREFALFYEALADALFEAGDLGKARQEYEKVTRLGVGRLSHGDLYAKAFYMLGRIAERRGDKARARKNYGKFLELWKDADPGLPEVEDARSKLAALGR